MKSLITKEEICNFFAEKGISFIPTTDPVNLEKGLYLISGEYSDSREQKHFVTHIIWRDNEGLLRNKPIINTLEEHSTGNALLQQKNWIGNELYLKILDQEFRFQIEEFQ